jgi:hypothetical protein
VSASRLPISGFTLVRNATLLDFPLEAALQSLLPAVTELVVNVGRSEDNTLDRVRAIGDSRIRIVESVWDTGRGQAMLGDETNRALRACRFRWGMYIQADEVLGDGGAELIAATIERHDTDPRVNGVVVDYRHFYGGFDRVASNRKWYRREVRAVRLDPSVAVHSYRDAQGFRAGPDDRRIGAVRSGAVMYHYGWARPIEALGVKRKLDGELLPALLATARPLLPWIPGMVPFRGDHPEAARQWIAERRSSVDLIGPRRLVWKHVRLAANVVLERWTGWRPFEFRNYELVR